MKYLGFTTINIFITVLISVVFDNSINYILALLNYSSLEFKSIHGSPYSNHSKAIELSFIAELISKLLEAKHWINRLHRKNMDFLKETPKASLRILGKVSEIKDRDTDNHPKKCYYHRNATGSLPQMRKRVQILYNRYIAVYFYFVFLYPYIFPHTLI